MAPSVVTAVSILSVTDAPKFAAESVAAAAVILEAVDAAPFPSVIAPTAVSFTAPGAVTLFRIRPPPVVTVTSFPVPLAEAVRVSGPVTISLTYTPPAVAVAVSVVTGICSGETDVPREVACKTAAPAVSDPEPAVIAPDAVNATSPVPALMLPNSIPS